MNTDTTLDELMDEVKAGNALAFSELHDRMRPHITAFLFSEGISVNDVEDCVQETLFKVWERCQSFDTRKGQAKSWIIRIAANQLTDMRRRACRQKRGADAKFVDITIRQIEDGYEERSIPEKYQALQNEVDALPDALREICDAFLCGESLSKAGQRLGYSRIKASRQFKAAREIMETSVTLREFA